MSYFNGAVYSEILNMDTSMSVILPQDSRWHRGIIPLAPGIKPAGRPKTLILLHGLTDNWVAWAHRSRIYSYAEYYDVAVLIPEVQRSFYQDMKNGSSYFTYITEELPRLAAEMFHISTDPEDLMIAGMSMGGYGALLCGLTDPGKYRAVGAFSSVCDMEQFVTKIPVRKETRGLERDVRGIFGEERLLPKTSDLKYLAGLRETEKNFPQIYMACGKQDELYEQNVELEQELEKMSPEFSWEAWEGFHDWDFWDVAIQKFLKKYV
ncbi:MAG: alpha/beta hydrolase [Blautia sp.]|jgi:putative tributyrin esterase